MSLVLSPNLFRFPKGGGPVDVDAMLPSMDLIGSTSINLRLVRKIGFNTDSLDSVTSGAATASVTYLWPPNLS